MVHALEQIHALINPGGYLIDLHPNAKMVEFILPLDDGEHFIGYMHETDDYIEYRQADESIDTAVANGLFQVERTGEFDFRTHADSFDELKTFLDENWSDSVITGEVIANAKKLEAEHGQREVIAREWGKIKLLSRQNV